MLKNYLLLVLVVLEAINFSHGGNESKIEDVPYFVQLIYDSEFHCGGAIISEDWILTAAHCLRKYPFSLRIDISVDELRIVSGSSLPGQGEFHRVDYFFVHENYDSRANQNDIGLIKLKDPIKFSDQQKLIKIKSQPVQVDDLLKVSGMGRINKGPDFSKVLKSTIQPVVDRKLCKKKWSKIDKKTVVTENMICMGWENITHSWHGDSGGPLVDVFTNELVGLVSFGDWEYPLRAPDLNTNVVNYRAWIETKTNLILDN